jgi:hypothetical protein
MTLLNETKKYVASIFEPGQIPHFERTLYWVKQLRPGVDEAIQIAAYAHDVGRASQGFKDFQQQMIIAEKTDEIAKKADIYHQEEGERMIQAFLSKHTKDQKFIDKVGFLVRNHEDGGTTDSDLVKDADSLSYFDTNVHKHLKMYPKNLATKKFNYMYNRISSKKAKSLAKPIYENAIKQLQKL